MGADGGTWAGAAAGVVMSTSLSSSSDPLFSLDSSSSDVVPTRYGTSFVPSFSDARVAIRMPSFASNTMYLIWGLNFWIVPAPIPNALMFLEVGLMLWLASEWTAWDSLAMCSPSDSWLVGRL